ncbi:hem oxygenase-like, multi-helical [Sarocladium implicatum]|nr:hem oxygenase-like, multi-helical [Sarocladium implicatum]
MLPSPESLPDRPLAEAIAVATRSSHTRLNKSIIARLPLVSKAKDPSPYVTGLLHIAPIYQAFETSWKTILDNLPAEHGAEEEVRHSSLPLVDVGNVSTAGSSQEAVPLRQPVVCDRLRTLLQQLRLPGLMRSSRLKADIQSITGWSEGVIDEQLRLTAETARLGEFTAHIKRSIDNRPHVLVAYSYILFMALFAGGRYIRATLESAGEDFWSREPSPVKPSMLECERRASGCGQYTAQPHGSNVSPTTNAYSHEHNFPLSFFHFATPEDGEDLKREFKSRLLEAEDVLTHREKQDIVQESICIFDNMELLVAQLDKVCAEDGEDSTLMANLSALMGKTMAMRLRDSVAVTKDRAARSSSRMSSSDDSSGICTVVRTHKAKDMETLDNGNVPGHPPVPASAAAMELCPALKSMRFDANLPIPVRPGTGATEGSKGAHYLNWLLLAAFGAIVVGTIMTTRRGLTTV